MDATTVTEKLIAVLGGIQADSGLACPPADCLQRSQSTTSRSSTARSGRVATSLLSTEIGCPIPNDLNVFVDEKAKRPRSISQIVDFLCTHLNQHSASRKGAA